MWQGPPRREQPNMMLVFTVLLIMTGLFIIELAVDRYLFMSDMMVCMVLPFLFVILIVVVINHPQLRRRRDAMHYYTNPIRLFFTILGLSFGIIILLSGPEGGIYLFFTLMYLLIPISLIIAIAMALQNTINKVYLTDERIPSPDSETMAKYYHPEVTGEKRKDR